MGSFRSQLVREISTRHWNQSGWVSTSNRNKYNSIFFTKNKIPPGRIAAYARFVCTFRPVKAEQNRTRLTVGGNLITDYTGETSTDTAGLELIKLHWLSVLSTKNAKYMTMDIGNFYLNTPLGRYEYMRINITDIPQEVIDENKLYENK
jgi:hypothetical protein